MGNKKRCDVFMLCKNFEVEESIILTVVERIIVLKIRVVVTVFR